MFWAKSAYLSALFIPLIEGVQVSGGFVGHIVPVVQKAAHS